MYEKNKAKEVGKEMYRFEVFYNLWEEVYYVYVDCDMLKMYIINCINQQLKNNNETKWYMNRQKCISVSTFLE